MGELGVSILLRTEMFDDCPGSSTVENLRILALDSFLLRENSESRTSGADIFIFHPMAKYRHSANDTLTG